MNKNFYYLVEMDVEIPGGMASEAIFEVLARCGIGAGIVGVIDLQEPAYRDVTAMLKQRGAMKCPHCDFEHSLAQIEAWSERGNICPNCGKPQIAAAFSSLMPGDMFCDSEGNTYVHYLCPDDSYNAVCTADKQGPVTDTYDAFDSGDKVYPYKPRTPAV